MSSHGQVRLSKVWKMLDACAPGHRRIEQKHNWRIEFQGRTYPNLQLGKRASSSPEVELGHIEKMIRHLAIDAHCAWKHLPQLNKPKTPQA